MSATKLYSSAGSHYNISMTNRRYPQKRKARRSSLEYRLRRALFGLIVLAVLSAGYWLVVLIKSAWGYLR
jgi:hypothetical protein